MEEINDRVQLSRNWRVFQLYSLQIALGCLSAFIVLNLNAVEKAFIKADIITFYAYFLVGVIVFGIIAFICSGGIGLFRLLNAKRLIKLLEKEDDGGV